MFEGGGDGVVVGHMAQNSLVYILSLSPSLFSEP